MRTALFSRHDMSTTMTRSLGDTHAARTCVATPGMYITVLYKYYAYIIRYIHKHDTLLIHT